MLLLFIIILITLINVNSQEQQHNNKIHIGPLSLPSINIKPSLTLEEAQVAINCDTFLEPILSRRSSCLSKSNQTEVDICTYFASDYEFIVSFLVHHLMLGVSHIIIYNNDDRVAWYNHPAVQCMLAEELVEIHPWLGDLRLLKGLNTCYKRRIPEIRNKNINEPQTLINTWGANFDIDEMLVLHQHECIGELLDHVKAPTLAVNWAFFVPEMPLSDFERTGNVKYMPPRDYNLHGVVLPHDRLLRRMPENQHVKSINRVACVDSFHNEHCPNYNTVACPPRFGLKPIDPQGHYIDCQPWTPWVDNYYPVVQLNHYWTLSLHDFLRKIHRGKGGSYAKNDVTQYRSSNEFFAHARPSKAKPFVNDTALIDKYGEFYQDIKQRCPKCFDSSLHFL